MDYGDKPAAAKRSLLTPPRWSLFAPPLTAPRCTIADIALYAYTHVADEGGFDLAGYPALRAWLARVAAQPGYTPITSV